MAVKINECVDAVKSAICSNNFGIKTGFKKLDMLTRGFHPSELVIVAARSSMGKSAFMIDLALHMGKDHNVAIFSLEMSLKIIVERMLANIGSINIHTMKLKGEAGPELERAAEMLKNRSIYIDDSSYLTPNLLHNKVEQIKPDIVFIDFLQLMRMPTKLQSRYLEVDFICQEVRAVGKAHNIPVVLLAQLNRAVEQRERHEPRLSDLRESGGIEQAADMVLFLHRPAYYAMTEYDPESEDDGEAYIYVAKNRNGPVGKVRCVWISEFTSFRDLASMSDE